MVFSLAGDAVLFMIFMRTPLAIRQIVRLTRYDNNTYIITLHFESGCEMNKTECRCANDVESTCLFIRHAKILLMCLVHRLRVAHTSKCREPAFTLLRIVRN